MKHVLTRPLVVLFVVMISAGWVEAAYLLVPQDYKSIQAAIEAAQPGDTVQVAAGEYNESIRLKEGVAVKGAGRAVTFLRGDGSWYQYNFFTYVVLGANNSSVSGFTINATGYYFAIYNYGVSADVIDNRIIGANEAVRNWYNSGGTALIKGNYFEGNADCVVVDYSAATVVNNVMKGWRGVGAANSRVDIINNTIIGPGDTSNIQPYGITVNTSRSTIVNNIITGNGTISGFGLTVVNGSETVAHHNLVWGNITNYRNMEPGVGDISADPLFVDPAAGNYHLKWDSPCMNAGDSSVVGSGWIDIDGEPRIAGISVDIGADEAYDVLPPVTQATTIGTTGENGWYTSDVQVTLTATDDLSGVARTEYTLDGGVTWLPSTTPILFSAEGVYNICYRSFDLIGNAEQNICKTISIDKSSPEVIATVPMNAQVNVTVTQVISVTFSDGIQPGLAFANISLQQKGKYPVAFTPSIAGTSLILTSSLVLDKNSDYVVTIPTSAVKNMAGLLQAMPVTFSFSTKKK